MKTKIKTTQPPRQPKAFALVACITILSLLLVIALGTLSLASVTVKSTNIQKHQKIAQANARLALQLAIAQLQEELGPDTRISANASITGEKINPHWLGAWDTTVESDKKIWPLIGKKTDSNPTAPYPIRNAYSDLRHTRPDLTNEKWKQELHRKWLVTNNGKTTTSGNIEILSNGTLGDDPTVLTENKVTVPKQQTPNGSLAWWTSDNNQKSSLVPKNQTNYSLAELDAAQSDNPALILENGTKPFANFTNAASTQSNKIISFNTAALTQSNPIENQKSLGAHYNDFTTASQSLFTDTTLGAFKKDLTPLLLSRKNSETVTLTPPKNFPSAAPFTSALPIIPGNAHDLLGPSFDALRDWAQLTYDIPKTAQTTFPSGTTRTRPATHWPRNLSDGITSDAADWAARAPKIHPIMTDSRFHYYFSHKNKNFRTHIIPRVCLWNPYNTELKTNEMVVLMPNPFYQRNGGIHFFLEDSEVERLRAKFPTDTKLARWIQKNHSAGDPRQVFKLRPRGNTPGLFPDRRYLAFTLLSTTLAPGECQVFSPRTNNPTETAQGISIQTYNLDNPSANTLSPSAPQGGDHFVHEQTSATCEIQATSWTSLSQSVVSQINFDQFFDYKTELVLQSEVENFPFILKAANAAPSNLTNILSSESFPTLQLVLANGTGGVAPTTYFSYSGDFWGSANTASTFGTLQTFAAAPNKNPGGTSQVGAKLLWLDESQTEALNPPLRYNNWTADHMAYNPALIANWNIRAQLTSRSPASQCADRWFMTSTGPWLLQFAPKSPQDFTDMPSLNENGTAFVKNPLNLAINSATSPNVILFDLPSPDYGILSLNTLRHAALTPYSWHPTYIIGHSLRDLHAPSESSAHPDLTENYSQTFPSTSWDYYIGGMKSSLRHGGYAKEIDSQGLLQIGNQSTSKTINGQNLTSQDDILPYDIAFETNLNLWDRFFISSMPLKTSTNEFDWDPDDNTKTLTNRRYQYNPDTNLLLQTQIEILTQSGGINHGFWNNAYLLKNKAAFNINSTSIPAWTSFLSGTLAINRPLREGIHNNGLLAFARHRLPGNPGNTNDAQPDNPEGWSGLRQLQDQEVIALATAIVEQVKLRGPFISVSDFVNRRLTDRENPNSHMGTIDAAIQKANLNEAFLTNSQYLTTTNNGGGAPDNNHSTFKDSYIYTADGLKQTTQPISQAWGTPGYLTQSDILDPLAPNLTSRGDTFTIRAFGSSIQNGQTFATAYLEATIQRSPNYLQHKKINAETSATGNYPTEPTIILDPLTGQINQGNLTQTNKKFGRRFIIKSFRWLNADEI